MLCTLEVYLQCFRLGCSGQGAWWPSSIFLGGSGSRARQAPKYSLRSKQGSAHSPRSALPIHHLARSSLAPLCVRPPLPQLLPSSFHSSFFLLLPSPGLVLPPLTLPWMQAALTDRRIACRKSRTFPAPQGSALCLPLPARQDSLGYGFSRFSATDYYGSPVQPCFLQRSLQHSITAVEVHWWKCQHCICGVSVLRLPMCSDRGVEQLLPRP